MKQRPVVLGKPGKELGPICLKKFEVEEPARVLFIGDTLKQDIGFANKCGFKSLLVLSGATTEEMMRRIENEEDVPLFYADNIGDFQKLIDRGD